MYWIFARAITFHFPVIENCEERLNTALHLNSHPKCQKDRNVLSESLHLKSL